MPLIEATPGTDTLVKTESILSTLPERLAPFLGLLRNLIIVSNFSEIKPPFHTRESRPPDIIKEDK
jgi:hypothetical protein